MNACKLKGHRIMKSIKSFQLYGIGTLLLVSMTGCDPVEDLNSWADYTAQKRGQVEYYESKNPYGKNHFQTFKSYFVEMANMALALKEDTDRVESLNKALDEIDINTFCRKVFIDENTWDTVVLGCTKNRFFLCAEEVRAYPKIVRSLRSRLNQKHRNRFDREPNCVRVPR